VSGNGKLTPFDRAMKELNSKREGRGGPDRIGGKNTVQKESGTRSGTGIRPGVERWGVWTQLGGAASGGGRSKSKRNLQLVGEGNLR